MGRPRQVTKRMPEDSSEPSEVEEEPTGHQEPMASHLTKLVVHLELADVGDSEEEMLRKCQCPI